jgi:hypothetical protein
MSLKSNFCSSPWFHMRITPSGQYEYCRWRIKDHDTVESIHNQTPQEYFQQTMIPIRQEFLSGSMPSECSVCAHQEQHGKVSGRQKQLLKVGVQLSQFDKMLASSPWVSEFAKGGTTNQLPQDWQIDLGNYCNSGCVFCSPASSSKLATEHLKLGLINKLPPPNWTDDPVLVQKFIDTLIQSPHIQYLHFIGGETVITPAFKTILRALIQAGLNRTATIGFTTNLSVWREDVVELLTQFQGVNLGMSVEAFKIINDYVRWPVALPTVLENMERWIELGQQQNWLMQFRTTPTCLTIGNLISVYEYAWAKGIAVESCNFLQEPAFMRPAVLPKEYRRPIIDRMRDWIQRRSANEEQIVNIRDPSRAKQQIVQDLESYVNYLESDPDQSWRMPELIQYLKRLESVRNNSILTYLPEYEELFRSAGY